MNRSILIVICDFLVLSAMSLSIGVGEMASTPKGGTFISRGAAQDAHIEQMHKELKKRAQVLSEKERLQEEKVRVQTELETLRARLAQLSGDVDSRTLKLNETSRELLNARITLQKQEKALADKTNALKNAAANFEDVSAKFARTQEELQAKIKELRQSREETASREAALRQSKKHLAAVSDKLKSTETRLRETELGLSYTKGSLSRTEKELSEARDKEEASTKRLYVRGVELEQTRVELANTRQLLNAAVKNLTHAKSELDKTKKNLADSASQLSQTREALLKVAAESKANAETLAYTRKQLVKTEELLRSDALTKYSKAAVQMSFHLKNERFMNDFELNETLYLPEIEIGGKTYLPGSFRALTGLLKQYAGYTRVVELTYHVKKPESSAELLPLNGPLWSLNNDPRACLIEIARPIGTPLKTITYAELKKRGLQNLTLFKFGSFGRETASLNGRCSIALARDDDPYLYIRNSLRSSSELSAATGDFVISKEGQFVGVVVSTAANSLNGYEEALCYIFPSAVNLKDAVELPLDRKKGAKYYTGFINALQKLQKTVSELDRSYESGK